MEIRRTRAADLPALHDIFIEAMAAVYRPHGFDPPAPPLEVFANQQLHVLAHDADGCAVAEDGGDPVGFASAWVRGDTWFLASLFVAPRAQARGVGKTLLDAVWGDGFLRRRTITDAIQPVSNMLYGRRGLVPATPVLWFGGRPRLEAGTDAGLEPADADDDDALRAIDAVAYGFDRSVDHACWGRLARRMLWRRDGRVVAYSYVFPGHPVAIGPVGGVDGAAAASALGAELARANGDVRVRIPGSSRDVVATALAAGLRLAPTPGLLLLGPGVPGPTSLAIGSYTLF
ncbi:MAG TPA: GNAT family N-acetyltransferase [Gaiellaceae bacterium]|jgi:GNAT superfamily N-acetyltransferase